MEEIMREIECRIGRQTHNFILMCDWNPRSRSWGDRITNPKGTMLEEWSAGMGLCILNDWGAITCSRPQGTSGVYQTWVREGGERLRWKWRVDKKEEILSDHFPIAFEFCGVMGERISITHEGWRKDTFVEENFRETLEMGLWPE